MTQGTVLAQEQITFSSGESGERKGATAGGDGAQAESWDRRYYQKPWSFAKRVISPLVSSITLFLYRGALPREEGPRRHQEGERSTEWAVGASEQFWGA